MTDYERLAAIADDLLERADEDDTRLARLLEGIDPEVRAELLTSDLLNAYQVYYYYFREDPGELPAERLMLTPASETLRGVLLDEVELFSLVFLCEKGRAEIVVTDGEQEYRRFSGKNARTAAENYVLENLA
ncbi:hypothetical protein [Methanofollis tationis]|uniref:Uncharacterized protein n=1 Tax=Methanofollis tationis TaxID=81417 RepID=A0A7K4HRH0_9EURY|nr:hypothetical protein [Methanofollis tationis]NVO67839.1 hypothetical protein [Methanofollis tationis]